MATTNILGGVLFVVLLFFQIDDSFQAGSTVYYGEERPRPLEPKEKWMKEGQADLYDSLRMMDNYGVAKNIILFIGDGMGMSTITAMRIYKGQKQGKTGEEGWLNFDKFPAVALSKVYATDRQIPESGTTGSAILTGVKTRYNVIGFDDSVAWKNCSTERKEAEVLSLRDMAEKAGKDTGFVSTARIYHATPAATYAKTCSRRWEDDSKVPVDVKGKCKDIALQFLERGKNIKVALGGGRRGLMPETEKDPKYPTKTGTRKDKRNLIQEWLKDKKDRKKEAKYVWNKDDFDKVDVSKTDYLLGLFEHSHMNYETDRDKAKEPSIADMTKKAIEMLKKNDKGFFLLVEGARIDQAHHDGKAKKAIEDGLAFEAAIEEALKLTDQKDTLIVVTSDHSHVFMMGGYPPRGNPLFGLTTTYPGEDKEPATDKMPYTTIVYGNGPGYTKGGPFQGRTNITGVNTSDINYAAQATVPLPDETHSGEDVPIYALGPMAHLFHGLHDNTYIAHVMSYAACIGHNKGHCEKPEKINIPGRLKCLTDAEDWPKPTQKPISSTVRVQCTTVLLLCGLLLNLVVHF